MSTIPKVRSIDPISDYASCSRDELIRLASRLEWFHRIDLGGGFITSGRWMLLPSEHTQRAMSDIDFTGKKVLDIGCWDGFYSFEAERRGAADVFAIDLLSQRVFSDHPTFAIAHAALKSNVRYFPNVSVYDIESLGVSDFDVIFFFGIYYHLKDPLRALAMLRRVMKDGGQLLVEGAILNEEGCHAKFFYRDCYFADPSNWWVPTVSCLREWLECSYFEIADEKTWGDGESWRALMIARAARRRDPSYLFPDELLRDFDH
jgi:tRNA (mo5U34)-methyltransferase